MNAIKKRLELLLRERDFRFLMGAQFFAQAGDGIVQASIAKLIVFGGQKGFDLEGARDPEELLRVALYIFVPYTLVSPFVGVVMDRWDRRRLLFVANGFRAVAVALIALIGTGSVADFWLYAVFLLTLASTRVVLATKAAALPASLGVTKEDSARLVEGNGISQLGGAMFQLGGAGSAFVAAELVDADPIAFVGALVYVLAAASSLVVRRAGEPRAKETFLHEVAMVLIRIWHGLREVGRTPQAAASISTYFWLRWLWSFTIVGIGFAARELLGDDDLAVVALTGGAGAVGAVLGFALAERLTRRVRTTGYLVLGASSVAGAGTAALGALEIEASLAALTFFLGFGFFLGKISLDTLVQEALGDDFRGRAFSLYDIAYNLAWVLAAAALVLTYEPSRRGGLVAAGGIVFLLGLSLIGVWFRRAGLLTERVKASAEVA